MESENTSSDITQEQEQKALEEDEEEEEEILRRRISRHPLYGLLVETHLNCLKVGSISEMERAEYPAMNLKQQLNLSTCKLSELDRFMETYCFALSKLKEAIEESQLKSMAFVNSMHLQLRDLSANSTEKPATTNSSSRENDVNHY